MNFGQAIFGLREVKIYNSDGSGGLALPASLLLHVTPRIETAEFKVEGVVVSSRSTVVSCDWELEAGSIELNVYGRMTGQSVSATGSAPNRQVSMLGLAGDDFPIVRIYGRAVDDSTGDILCRMYRCRLTGIEGSFREGQFYVTSAAGISLPDPSVGCYEFVQRETTSVL